MQPRRPIQRLAWAVAVSSITAAAVAGFATAGAPAATIPAAGVAPCVAWTGGEQPPDPGGSVNNNTLWGVAVLSPCNAWAVGDYDPGQTLIVHWDGASWTQVSSPDPATPSRLFGVHALSASNVWAVGEYFDGSIDKTLIVHWDGSAWTQVPSPNVSGATQNVLKAVRGSSATNVWAVGYFVNSNNVDQTLILHWNGTSWKQVPSPDPSGPALDQELTSVASNSAQDAWAVGFYYTGVDKSMILHWNGSSWKQVTSPNPGSQGTFLLRRALHLGQQRVGSGLGLQRHGGQDPDRALGRLGLEAGKNAEPGRCHAEQRPQCRRRHLRDRRMGSGRLRQRHRHPDPCPALGWVGLDTGDHPEPWRFFDRRLLHLGGRQFGWQRVGGGPLLQRRRGPDPRHPLLLTGLKVARRFLLTAE